LTGVVSKEAVESAIRSRVPKGTEELNLKAFSVGIETAQKLQ
jgi:2-oxoglutarate ferredoxin oxidoreductase subunit gamma